MKENAPNPEMLEEKIQEQRKINRLIYFRNKYVNKSQTKAAKELGIPQSALSLMEQGSRKISLKLLHALYEQYDMNADWFLTGRGTETVKQQKPKNTIDTIGELRAEVSLLNKKIQILEINQNKAFKLIHQLQIELTKSK